MVYRVGKGITHHSLNKIPKVEDLMRKISVFSGFQNILCGFYLFPGLDFFTKQVPPPVLPKILCRRQASV
jgi:hypothetical protein